MIERVLRCAKLEKPKEIPILFTEFLRELKSDKYYPFYVHSSLITGVIHWDGNTPRYLRKIIQDEGFKFVNIFSIDSNSWNLEHGKCYLLGTHSNEFYDFPSLVSEFLGKLREYLTINNYKINSIISLNQCTIFQLSRDFYHQSPVDFVKEFLLWDDGDLWSNEAWAFQVNKLKEQIGFTEQKARQRLAWVGSGWMCSRMKNEIHEMDAQEICPIIQKIQPWIVAALKYFGYYQYPSMVSQQSTDDDILKSKWAIAYISALCDFLPCYREKDGNEFIPSNSLTHESGPREWFGINHETININLRHLILDGWVTLWPFKEEDGSTRLYYQPGSMALLYWAARRLDKPWTKTPEDFLHGYNWSDPHWFGGNWHQPSTPSIVPTHQSANTGSDAPATPVREAAHPGSHTGACEPEKDDKIRILHLSDLHFDGYTQVKARLQWLLDDIRKGDCLGIKKLDCLVVTGDFTDRCNPDGFDKAYQFITELTKEFGLNADRCILVPGNHDVAGKIEDIYQISHNADGLKEDEYIKEGIIVLKKNPEKYRLRFKPYSENLFSKLAGKDYPIEPTEQGLVVSCWDLGIQFLALNSCWQIDGHPANRKRSGIHADALANALWEANIQEVDARANVRLGENVSVLRIAVWHHAVAGPEMMKNVQFLGHLPNHGVKLGLHGDIHEYQREQIGHWLGDKKLHIAGCGSFGAPREGLPDSTPRLYNLLEISRELNSVRIHTRCQPKPDGPWKGWYEWPAPGGEGRVPYYDISWTKNS